MARFLPLAGAFTSVVALILFSVGLSTNNWVSFDKSDPKLNPTIVNSKLDIGGGLLRQDITDSTRHIEYALANYGLWIGCYREHKGAVSCAFVRASCRADTCWIRRTPTSRTKTCQDSPVVPITSCTAYNAVRVLLGIATLVVIVGVSAQLVSVVTLSRTLAMLAGIIVFTGGLLMMTGFAVFYSEEMARNGVRSIAHIGWSLILVVVSWPATLLAGILSCCAASTGMKRKEVSDYSGSNY